MVLQQKSTNSLWGSSQTENVVAFALVPRGHMTTLVGTVSFIRPTKFYVVKSGCGGRMHSSLQKEIQARFRQFIWARHTQSLTSPASPSQTPTAIVRA